MVDVFASSPVSVDSEIEVATTDGRKNAVFIVKINGIDIKDRGFDVLIRYIKIEQSLNTSDALLIQFHNANRLLDSCDLFKEGFEVEVHMGWAGLDVVNHGTFIIDEIIYEYHNKRLDSLKLLCHNKLRLLTRGGMKRRSFEDRKDSEIVQLIAKEHNLKSEVDDTKVKFELVVQANQNDFQFIMDRAGLYGYSVYVKNDTLYFKQLTYKHTNKEISRIDLTDSSTSIITKNKNSTITFLKASKVKKDQVDWQTLDVLKTQDQDLDDFLIKNSPDSNKKKAKEVVSEQAIAYIIGTGHDQTFDEMQRLTNNYSQSSRWLQQVHAEALGLEFVRPGLVIRYNDLTNYSGDY
jgi:phage protein D